MALRNVRYAGLAEDPFTGGVATNPQPQFYVDASEVGLDSPSETDMEVPSSIGMTARAKRSGPYIPEGNLAYNTDIGTLGWFLKWGLMGYAFTSGGGTDFNTHEIWANDVRYFAKICARIGKDEFEHVFEHCTVGTIEIAIERELVGLTAEMTASRDFENPGGVKSVENDILPGLPAEYALSYHDVNLFIDKDNAATPAMINVSDIAMSLTASLENNVDSERGVTLGSRFPRRHGSSGRNVTLSTELHFDNMLQKRKFWGGLAATGPGKLGGMTFPVEAYIDSGSAFGEVDDAGNTTGFGDARFVWPKAYYNAVPLSPSGREEMSSEVEMNCHLGVVTLADGVTEKATPMYVKIKNLKPMMAPATV